MSLCPSTMCIGRGRRDTPPTKTTTAPMSWRRRPLAGRVRADRCAQNPALLLPDFRDRAVHVFDLKLDRFSRVDGRFAELEARARHAVHALMRLDPVANAQHVVVLIAEKFFVLENVFDVCLGDG